MEHLDYQKRIDAARHQIQEIKRWNIRNDLTVILKNCQNQYTLMDKEYVNCRRTRKVTATYTELATTLDEWMHLLEKRITWANLL
jgi:hypothetical protein